MATRETRARPRVQPIQTHHIHADFAGAYPGRPRAVVSAHYVPSPLSPHSHRPEARNGPAFERSRRTSRRLQLKQEASMRSKQGDSPTDQRSSMPSHGYPSLSTTMSMRRHQALNDRFDRRPSSSLDIASKAPFAARRPSHSPDPPALRETMFERFREDLWGHGAGVFGDLAHADNLVIAMEPPPNTELTPRAEALSERRLTLFPAKAPVDGSLTIRAIVRPRDKRAPAFYLTRRFDVASLNATIPGTLPAPSTPTHDGLASPTLLAVRHGLQSPASPLFSQSPALLTRFSPFSPVSLQSPGTGLAARGRSPSLPIRESPGGWLAVRIADSRYRFAICPGPSPCPRVNNDVR